MEALEVFVVAPSEAEAITAAGQLPGLYRITYVTNRHPEPIQNVRVQPRQVVRVNDGEWSALLRAWVDRATR